MDPHHLEASLNNLAQTAEDSGLLDALADITNNLKESGDADITHVRVILQFMERHPGLDIGVPGPLVHFVETFYGRGYERELIASVRRKPTAHSVWMLNRLLNATGPKADRMTLLEALKKVIIDPAADDEARESAARFEKRFSENLIEDGIERCKKLKACFPELPVLDSIANQLHYLKAALMNDEADRSRLGQIILGIQTARELENLDMETADVFYEIAALSRLMTR